jgi:signal transduction histidine kinase
VHGPPPLHVWDGVAAAVLAVFGASATRGLETLLFATASAMLLLVRRLPLPVTTAIAALTVTGLNLVTTYGYVDGQVLNLSGGNALVGPSLVLLAAAGFLCASSAPLDWRLGIPLVPLLLAPQRSMLALGLLLGLAVGAAWRSQASTRREQARADQLERVTETQRAEQIGLLERGELARELHDIVGHHVTAVVVLAEAAQARGTDADGDLGRIADTARAALGELDTLVTSLREPGTRAETSVHRGLVDLPDLLDPLHHAGVTTALHVAVREEFGQGLQLTTYRIVQEALTNVMRHASAHTVRIAVVQHPEALELSIDDDGVGFDPVAVTRGRGLLGIGERVQGHGGTWSVAPSALGGVRLSVTLPVVLAPALPPAPVVPAGRS